MGDDRRRELERSAAQGDLAARAGLLRERVRVGELREERLSLAAYLEDEASLAALGGPPLVGAADLEDWVGGLAPWGTEAVLRAAVAAARSALPAWESRPEAELQRPREAPRRAIDAAAEWLRCPCADHAADAERAALVIAWPGQPAPVVAATWAALSVSHGRRGQEGETAQRAVRAARQAVGAPALRAQIRADLVAWALAAGPS